ncbi:MAG TPA: LuxR C-terminal-related transcriptional regulator [Albitalea sp.]
MSAGASQSSWSEACRLSCDVIGADAASIIIWRGSDRSVALMEGYGFDVALVREYEAYYYKLDLLMQNVRPVTEWQVSDELFPDRQWGRHEFFGDFLRRHRVGQVIGLTLRIDTDIIAGLSFHRQQRHAIRAADLSCGKYAEFAVRAFEAFSRRHATVQAVQGALGTLAGPDCLALIMDGSGFGHELSTRGSRERVLQGERLRFDGRTLSHTDRETGHRLRRLLHQACSGGHGRMFIRGEHGGLLRIDAKPVPGPAKYGFNERSALVFVARLDTTSFPDEADLRATFGLTVAEARVLCRLCMGLSVGECAVDLNCRVSTIRTHVSHLLSRMDCTRQSELVRAGMLMA